MELYAEIYIFHIHKVRRNAKSEKKIHPEEEENEDEEEIFDA